MTRRAATDIIGTACSLVDGFGRTRANEYLCNLESAFMTLAVAPSLGSEYRGTSRSVRVHLRDNHLIVYAEETQSILIVRVLEYRKLWADFL